MKQKYDRNKSAENYKEKYEKYKRELQKINNLPIERIVEIGKEIGRDLSSNISTTQIYKFLDAVRRIQAKFDSDKVILLRPKLAYLVGREKKEKKLKSLISVLDPAIMSAYKDRDSFQKLVYFIESIVAYHRFYRGKD